MAWKWRPNIVHGGLNSTAFACQNVCLHFETILWHWQCQVSLSLYMSHCARLLSWVLQTQSILHRSRPQKKRLHLNRIRTKKLKKCTYFAVFIHDLTVYRNSYGIKFAPKFLHGEWEKTFQFQMKRKTHLVCSSIQVCLFWKQKLHIGAPNSIQQCHHAVLKPSILKSPPPPPLSQRWFLLGYYNHQANTHIHQHHCFYDNVSAWVAGVEGESEIKVWPSKNNPSLFFIWRARNK